MSRFALTAAVSLFLAAGATTGALAAHHESSEMTAEAEAMEIVLDNFSFGPAEIELEAGKAYALTFKNVGFPHDFTAEEFFAAAEIAEEDAGKVVNGAVDVAPGTSVTVHLVPAAGTYDLICARPGHADNGMTGSITVS